MSREINILTVFGTGIEAVRIVLVKKVHTGYGDIEMGVLVSSQHND